MKMSNLNYNKKVLKEFQKPSNMGSISNPDGHGVVGNPTCLLPNERIHKNSGVVEISNLEKNQRVLTHTGGYESVVSATSRPYAGKIVTLQNKLGRINITPEHLVFAIKIPKKDKFFRNKGKRQLMPAWYHADQLEKKDLVLYPILDKEENIRFLEINITKKRYDFRSKEIPNKIPLDEPILRLFGYFLAEGNIQEKPCKNYISFTLNIKEDDIIDDIKQISKNLFNLCAKVKEKPEQKKAVVYLYSANLARWFKGLFGNGAENKKIPDFLMNLTIKKQKALIYGLWKGDGYINVTRNGARAGYATISYQLAQQIKILLLRQKIIPSIYIDRERVSKWAKHKKSWRIHIGQRDSLMKICDLMKVEYNPKSYESIDSWIENGYLFAPITRRDVVNYKGKVNNLEVNNAHSFVSDAFCLHNCGDVMEVFLKIKNNKIVDIKAKTFGCVAAIATTSVLTKLVKGKSVDEAIKITKDDIVKTLGDLPPIKYHCSILGIEALHKAIEDYKKKASQ